MKLVDFRFVPRHVPAPERGPDVSRLTRILQVRHRDISVCNVDGTVRVDNFYDHEKYQWGGWEDVPLGVEE
jgi:hypothetical protein